MWPNHSFEGTAEAARASYRLRDEAHAKGCADTADGIETRFTAWPKGFLQGFPCDTRILRNLRHTPRAGNIAKRRHNRYRGSLDLSGSVAHELSAFPVEGRKRRGRSDSPWYPDVMRLPGGFSRCSMSFSVMCSMTRSSRRR